MPLAALTDVSVAYGHLPLLDRAGLTLEAGERVAVIGRNGTGKSTLLRLLDGQIPPDAGTLWRDPAVRSARLDQDVPPASPRAVFDVVADGLGELGEIVAAYHHAAQAVAERPDDERMATLGRLQQELDRREGWRVEQRVELIVERLALPADQPVETLSGGWRRRVMLARTLVAEPDLLLLDEPTNHLDIEAIRWLEERLATYAGTVVFVTHDRAFLRHVATRIVELDRGRLTSWPGDYDTFLEKKEAWLANEARQRETFDKKLSEEEAWLRQGIKARRTRNEGRVRALMAMRAERAARRDVVGTARLAIGTAGRSGHVVFDAEHVSFSREGRPIVRDFTARIARGDRIGLVGPNGAGKTTLLRLLVGELTPDAGEIHRGTNLEIAYFDQQRQQLDPERSVADTVAGGNDVVVVDGQPRHVHGYLRDFLFPAERARSPVKALSGGERNRLLLARLFTKPANVLVLDEPTNDLDLETLELLESELAAFAGTILIVSHDRALLDNLVTSVYAFEGEGRVVEYVGGYEDWQRQRAPAQPDEAEAPAPPAGSAEPARARPPRPRPAKLSYKERRELDALPDVIARLEDEIRAIEAKLASPDFYAQPPDAVSATVARHEAAQAELTDAYTRWHDLDSRA